jgi:hypothetical protein
MSLALPFVGRIKEADELRRLHALCSHAVILGPAGIGKTALVAEVQNALDLVVCPHSEHLSATYDSLEISFGLTGGGLKLPQRRKQLLHALAETKRTLVFDGVSWTTPRLSSFFEAAMERVPVWICTRSEHPWDIGHVWSLLWNFARVELKSLALADTRSLIETCIEQEIIPCDVRSVVEWLQHRSKGNPLVLRELLDELSMHSYDLSNPHALELLDLDRRIHEIFPVSHGSAKLNPPPP